MFYTGRWRVLTWQTPECNFQNIYFNWGGGNYKTPPELQFCFRVSGRPWRPAKIMNQKGWIHGFKCSDLNFHNPDTFPPTLLQTSPTLLHPPTHLPPLPHSHNRSSGRSFMISLVWTVLLGFLASEHVAPVDPAQVWSSYFQCQIWGINRLRVLLTMGIGKQVYLHSKQKNGTFWIDFTPTLYFWIASKRERLTSTLTTYVSTCVILVSGWLIHHK